MNVIANSPNRCLEPNPNPRTVLFCGYFISITQLSLITGIGLSHVCKIFLGTRNPSVKTARKLAEGLGMTIQAFLRGLDDRRALEEPYLPVETPHSVAAATPAFLDK